MNNNIQYRLTLKDFFRKTMLGAVQDTARLDNGMNKLNRTIGAAGRLFAGYFAVSTLKDFGSQILQSTANMQGFENAIRASAGTDALGNKNISFLNQQVDRLGLSLMAAQSGYKTLMGSVMGTTLQGDKANTIFRQVSEAAAVLGLSAEQTEGSFLALGQMISKGTVQAEELRGQLAERIPGAFQIGARAMGVSTEKLGEMMKEGLVKADDFLIKFGNELEKTFGGKLDAATGSLRSNLNRWDTEWERLRVNMGNSQTGMINGTISWAQKILKNFNDVLAGLNRMDEAFAKTGKDLNYSLMERFNNTLFMGSTNDWVNYLFTGGKGKMEMFERSLQNMYVKPSERDHLSALRSKENLLKLKMSTNKSFIHGDINKLEYDRRLALIGAALEKVVANAAKPGVSPGLGTSATKEELKSTPIGSATEVFGARPQNINIKLDRLGDVHIHTNQTIHQDAQQVKGIFSKELLEVLNDANQVASR